MLKYFCCVHIAPILYIKLLINSFPFPAIRHFISVSDIPNSNFSVFQINFNRGRCRSRVENIKIILKQLVQDKKFKYAHFSHFHSLIWLDKLNLWKRIYSFLPPFSSFYSFPQLLVLVPAGWYSLCKHIINFFQIWNWVKIFHSQLYVSLDSLALKIISNNHGKLVSLSLMLTKVQNQDHS